MAIFRTRKNSRGESEKSREKPIEDNAEHKCCEITKEDASYQRGTLNHAVRRTSLGTGYE